MADLLIWLALVANVVIMLNYAAIGLLVAPKFDVPASGKIVTLTKLAVGTFFVTCALTHLHMAWHLFDRTGPFTGLPWLDQDAGPTWHYVLNHVVQAIAGTLAVWVLGRSISVRVYNKTPYLMFVKRRIDELEAEITRAEHGTERREPN